MRRRGATRELARFFDEVRPHAAGIAGIGSGDARILATRFALDWAYRRRQALFWRAPFAARAVREHRGLLIADAEMNGRACALAAMRLSASREAYIPELRTMRRALRQAQSALVFGEMPQARSPLAYLALEPIGDGVWLRGLRAGDFHAVRLTI